jgi:outer membrane protein OmpA-like peptidoglycan-associated protein
MDTVHVLFDLDNAFLNARAEKQIEKVVKKYGSSGRFMVLGYADYQGDAYYNDMLAMRRAQSTVAQLKKNGVDNASIKLVIGHGEVRRDRERHGGYAEDRRVDIIIKGVAVTKATEPPLKPISKPLPPPVKPPEVKKDTVARAVSKKNIEEVRVGETLKIENLYFVGGRDIIKMGSEKALSDLYELLKADTSLKIQIEGHVCCTNYDDEDGMDLATGRFDLSYMRAKAVQDYLVYRGIRADRLSCKGMARTMPLTKDESTDQGADMNRRVEIRIIDK